MAVDFALESARLAGWDSLCQTSRLREQARSHSWMEYTCKKQVGCQAAFASKLAPTVGWSTPAKNRSAVRPPSRAGSLPQLDGVHLQETGRLSGRLREQARSHRRATADSDRLCPSPLNRMSVSSAAALDLAVLAPSAGFVPGLIRGWERSHRLAKPNTARGGAAKQTVGAAPGSIPERRNPEL
jgi:hypothetical protein